MEKTNSHLLVYAAAAAFLILSTNASATPVGISLGAGTLGPGVALSYSVHEKMNVRLGLNRFNYDFELEFEENDYEGEVELNTMTALLDWHPWAGSFRLSAGLVSNSNQLTGTATTSDVETVEINGKTIALEDAGSVDTEVTFDPTAAYFGLGWGDSTKGGGFSFFSDFGVMLQGEPEVDIEVQFLDAVALDENDLEQETKKIEDDLSGLSVYPVISIGFAYNL